MTKTRVLNLKLRRFARELRSDCDGQDFVEYALVGAFVVATATALVPSIAASTQTILSKANSILILAQQ